MYEYRATVRRVIDGDTLEVDIDLGFKTILKKEKLRLLGIDTPELRSRNINERAHAQEAKYFVEKLLPPDSEIIVRTEKDTKGKYGRYLARVYLPSDNKPLGEMLADFGYQKKDEYE